MTPVETLVNSVLAGLVQLFISWLLSMHIRSLFSTWKQEVKIEIGIELSDLKARIHRLEDLVMERAT